MWTGLLTPAHVVRWDIGKDPWALGTWIFVMGSKFLPLLWREKPALIFQNYKQTYPVALESLYLPQLFTIEIILKNRPEQKATKASVHKIKSKTPK